MRFVFLCNPRIRYSGWAIDSTIYINCAKICNHDELLDTIHHEVFHTVLNVLKVCTSEKADHFILGRIDLDWF